MFKRSGTSRPHLRRPRGGGPAAECNSAIPQITNLRYGFTPAFAFEISGLRLLPRERHTLPGDRLVEKVAHGTGPDHNFLAAQRAGLLRESFPNHPRGAAVDGDHLH